MYPGSSLYIFLKNYFLKKSMYIVSLLFKINYTKVISNGNSTSQLVAAS